jgi:hypothetical protein
MSLRGENVHIIHTCMKKMRNLRQASRSRSVSGGTLSR